MGIDYINDDVHGRIEINEIECDIVKTSAFQRLGRIKQLGLASLVFPSATHTRFSHSLGTLHVMSKIIKQLNKDGLHIKPFEERNLRLAALLHDIGQYPLSHAIEFVYKRINPSDFFENNSEDIPDQSPIFLRMATSQTESRFDKASDKYIGIEILRKDKELISVFEKHKIYTNDVQEIINIIEGKHKVPIFKQLMDSHYDCDRLDSICRDSRLCGVTYGNIDINYFIENLHCVYDPPYDKYEYNRYLAVNKKRALHTLEHYLVSRYFMYSQIIHHRNIKSFELLAKAIFFGLAQRGLVYPNYQHIINSIGTNDFLFFDDNYFFTKIFDYYKKPDADEQIKNWINRLLNRKPLTVVGEIKKLQEDAEYYSYKTWFFIEKNLDTLCKEIGIRCDEIIPNEIAVEFVPVETDILSILGKSAGPKEVVEAKEKYRLSPRLYNDQISENFEMLLVDPSSFVSQLSKLKLIIITIYSTSDDKSLPNKLMSEFYKRSRNK